MLVDRRLKAATTLAVARGDAFSSNTAFCGNYANVDQEAFLCIDVLQAFTARRLREASLRV
jgi:hypothetical protein